MMSSAAAGALLLGWHFSLAAGAYFAGHVDFTFVRIDQAFNDGQPQTGAHRF